MRYKNVCLEAIAYTLPDEVVTSAEIETRLEPLYRRLRLPEGRLELMTGITERRFWPPGTLPSEKSSRDGRKGDRTLGHRSTAHRCAGSRLGLPRFSRTGHGLRRPSPPGLARELRGLRCQQRMSRALERRDPGGQHDRVGPDRRRRRRGDGERPGTGRGDHCPSERRGPSFAPRHQGGLRVADDRRRQRGHRAMRSVVEPHGQPAVGRRGPLRTEHSELCQGGHGRPTRTPPSGARACRPLSKMRARRPRSASQGHC